MGDIALIEPIEVSGRKFTSKQILQIQDTVSTFSKLSRTELAQTVCEHFGWQSPNGRLKVDSCLRALERFESLGLLSLPAVRAQEKPCQPTYGRRILNLNHAPLKGDLVDVAPLGLRLVTSKDQRHLWNSYVDRYHYLGYKRPFGPHLRYFITSRKLQDQYLGCLLFAPAAWALKARDEWIGWSEADRKKRLSLVVNNSRFLIFPWIEIDCLASRALSMVASQVAGDWHEAYGYRPVLLETFVDPTKFEGTCYQAANWQHVGNTAGRGRDSSSLEPKTTSKKIFLYPLAPNFRSTLRNETLVSPLPKSANSVEFVKSWAQVAEIIETVAREYDAIWQKRDRVINSMMLVLLIFRVLLSKNSQGYYTTILEFWDKCHKSKLSLPQRKAISASAFSEARNKLDENIFKEMNSKILRASEKQTDQYNWKGHQLFAVDGSKINLPRPLLKQGFDKNPTANYPQGLLSTLYQLKSQMPYDFDLVKHGDERICALAHLCVLKPDNVVVYDRGYFSYQMLHAHAEPGVHAIFRLPKSSYSVIDNFIAQTTLTDTIVTIEPNARTRREMLAKHPENNIKPLNLRLIKYTHDETEYYLGTTLLADSYSIADFSDVYHSRWGIEELYKISKKLIGVDDFHGRSERGIRQELYAHFVLITLGRLFANHGENEKNNGPNNPVDENQNSQQKPARPLRSFFKVNFKNCLLTMESDLESLILNQNETLTSQVTNTLDRAMAATQKVRPNRSYPRVSMKPDSRWRPSKEQKIKKRITDQLAMSAVTP